MKSSIFIYHHLGLGDHIICNAIIRYYSQKYDYVYNFVKPQNFQNVYHMYRDLTNLKLITMNMSDIDFFIKVSPNNNYLIVGHQKLHEILKTTNNKTFDEIFYEMARVPFEEKWNRFYFQRDLEKEKEAFNKIGIKENEEFIFVHDDKNNDRVIDENFINKDLKIIRPADYKDIRLFDFIHIIENAKEVHCMDSSFSCLIDTMQIKNDNLFMHLYVRKDNSPPPKFKLNWKIIK